MTFQSMVARLVPAAVRGALRRRRERRRLRRQARVECDPSTLARLTPSQLRDGLSNTDTDRAWVTDSREIDAFQIPTTAGGVNRGDRRALYYLVRHLRPRGVLEIGTHVGASTIHMAAALRSARPPAETGPSLTTVDIDDVNDAADAPWRRFGCALSPERMVRCLGMSDCVRFVQRSSLDFLRDGATTYDLVFLDGDHSASNVYQELPAALRRLAPGGLVVLHDYFPGGKPLWPEQPVIPGPHLAVERLQLEGAKLQILAFGCLPWPTKYGGRVTSLAAVVREPLVRSR